MTIGYAENVLPNERFSSLGKLRDTFGLTQDGSVSTAAQTRIETYDTATENTDDHLVLDPYIQSLKQQVFAKIMSGKHGEAIDLLYDSLDEYGPYETYKILSDFKQEFEQLGLQSLVMELNDTLIGIQNSYRELGMDSDFFMTGPNAEDTFDGPVVERNRYSVEAHFEREKFKAPQFIQPYLGLRLG